MALVTVAELLLKLLLMQPQQLRKKASRPLSSSLTNRTSRRSTSYLKTRIRGSRPLNAVRILVLIELSRRLHQAYRFAYDKQAADQLLPQNTSKVPLPLAENEALESALRGLRAGLGFGLLTQDCLENVIAKLNKAFGFDLKKFANYLSGKHEFYNGLVSTAPIQGTLSPVDIPPDPTQVMMAFYRTEGATDAVTSTISPHLLVFFRPSAIDTSNRGINSRNFSLLLHEGIHGFTKARDDQIQAALDPSLVGGASVNISKYINEHCFQP